MTTTYTLLTGHDNHLHVTYRSWQLLTRYLQVMAITYTLLIGHDNHLTELDVHARASVFL